MSLLNPIQKLHRLHYSMINTVMPYRKARWATTLIITIIFTSLTQHFFTNLVTYLLGFYLILLIVNYFIPKGISQDLEQIQYDSGFYGISQELIQVSTVETNSLEHSNDKPLARCLSQIQIWQRTSLAVSLGLIVSYFKMLEIDVFWPLLLVYFGGLSLYTVLKILKTMKKYNYDLTDFAKQSQQTNLY